MKINWFKIDKDQIFYLIEHSIMLMDHKNFDNFIFYTTIGNSCKDCNNRYFNCKCNENSIDLDIMNKYLLKWIKFNLEKTNIILFKNKLETLKEEYLYASSELNYVIFKLRELLNENKLV